MIQDVTTAGELWERLLRVWLETPLPDNAIAAYGKIFWPTATKNGVTLHTTPSQGMALTEKNLSYLFIDNEGRILSGFEGQAMGQAQNSSLKYFYEKVDIRGADWRVLDKCPPSLFSTIPTPKWGCSDYGRS